MSRIFHPRWLVSVFTLLLVLLPGSGICAPANTLPESPEPYYIRDDAGWLGPDAFQRLDTKLKTFERETSSQIVVAIFPRIPEDAEMVDFSQRLFEKWRPGQADKDNGAIFLVFAEDLKMRIHTGYGMEGVLPDARCKQIIQNVVAPLLRQSQLEQAIDAGVDAMIAAAKGEYKGDGTTRLDGKKHGLTFGDIVLFLIVAFIVAGIVFPRLFSMADVIFSDQGRSRTGGDMGWGGPPGGGGGWGGGSGGGDSGGGFGGGGFSGGGGDSGGGGASGGW